MKFNKIYIELTNICGLQCTFCPSKNNKPSTIPLKSFDTILKQVKQYTNIITFHIFGDPLTLSNLKEYLDIAQKNNLKVEITTTGYFLKNFPLELFLHPTIRQINFSLNSYNKNEMKVTLLEYLEPMFNLCKLKLEQKIHSFINFRLWNLDEDKSEDNFNQMVIHFLETHFNINLGNIDYQKSIRLENQILLDFDTYFEWPSLNSDHISDGFCYGLSSHIGILSNGTVVPCCLDGYGVINLGNIYENSLTSILQSKKSQNIIENFKNHIACEELCQKCTFKTRF
ncbi:MAG: radical SAM/SPASM domain-containing protein [Arcobacteraceae bacterium]|nr:radical SAM/SPASM domain-containing protein [Arcobacteraceae bacterium]